MKKKESAGLRLSLKQWAYLNTSYRIKKILSVFKCRARTFGRIKKAKTPRKHKKHPF